MPLAHFSKLRVLLLFVVLSCSFLGVFFIPDRVMAAELSLPKLESQEQVQVDHPALPTQEQVVVSGVGVRGAEVTVTASLGQKQLFSVKTTVDQNDHWQATLPPFAQVPDQLQINSDIKKTTPQVIESTTVAGATAVASVVLLQLLVERIIHLLQAAGLLAKRTTRGFVFDEENKQPVPFSLLTIESMLQKADGQPQLKETVVSTVDGLFRTINMPPGKYKVLASHPDYKFPTTQKRPWYATPLEFYRGEVIELNEQNRLNVMFIPLQPRKRHGLSFGHWINLRVLQSITNYVLHSLSLPMGVISTILVLFNPSLINFGLASLYLIFGAIEIWKGRKYRQMSGVVTREKEELVPQAVVQIIQSPPDELAAVVMTDTTGQFKIRLPRSDYRINVVKDGLIPDQEHAMSFELISLTKDMKNLHYRLKVPPVFDWTSQSAPAVEATPN